MVNMLFLMTFCCFGQNVDAVETQKSSNEDIFMEDFIGFHGKKYTIAMIDESLSFMVSEKNLDKEIGVVEEFIEDYFENITTQRTFSSSWDTGTKLFKIKNIDENKYIAIEWIERSSENKYYVYCHQKDPDIEQQLQKLMKELQK